VLEYWRNGKNDTGPWILDAGRPRQVVIECLVRDNALSLKAADIGFTLDRVKERAKRG